MKIQNVLFGKIKKNQDIQGLSGFKDHEGWKRSQRSSNPMPSYFMVEEIEVWKLKGLPRVKQLDTAEGSPEPSSNLAFT